MGIKVEMWAEFRGITFNKPTLSMLAKYFDDEHDAFVKGCTIVHRKSVFQVLTRIIRLCNVDTGRLRGSFTPLMDKYGYKGFAPFINMQPMESTATLKQSKDTKTAKGFSQAAVDEGKALGDFIDAVLNTTIATNVVYASDVNSRSQFLSKALAWGDVQYNKNFENFFKQAEKKGWIPEQDPNDEGEP